MIAWCVQSIMHMSSVVRCWQASHMPVKASNIHCCEWGCTRVNARFTCHIRKDLDLDNHVRVLDGTCVLWSLLRGGYPSMDVQDVRALPARPCTCVAYTTAVVYPAQN